MTHDRGIGQYDNPMVESLVRAEYEARWPFREWDFLFADEYVTGNLFTIPKGGGSANILVQNPSTSDHYIVITKQFTTDTEITVESLMNVSVSDFGTETEVVQRRSDFDNVSDSTSHLDVTWSQDSDSKQLPSTVIGSDKGGGAVLQDTGVMVAPGDNALFEAINDTADSSETTIELKITEVPRNLVDTITQSPSP